MLQSLLLKIFTKERTIWLIITVILVGVLYYTFKSKNSVTNDYLIAIENNKAYQHQLNTVNNEVHGFRFTIEQLQYFNDSITLKLLETQKKLNIKDSEVEEMEYIMTEFERVDTIKLKDTIFIQTDFKFDTVFGDKWMNVALEMSYPNMVSVKPTVKSEKSIIVYSKKETVEPPKKFFLCRWFQKKHTVLEIVVEEENPYIINQKNVYYDIIK